MDIRNVTQFSNFVEGNNLTRLDSNFQQIVNCLNAYKRGCDCWKRSDRETEYKKCYNQYLSTVKRVQFTARTLTKKSDLLADIEEIRRTGFASNIDGMVEGTTSFGAGVYENAGKLVAALVISGPQSRMVPRIDELKRLAFEAGAEMSRLSNYVGAYPPPARQELD